MQATTMFGRRRATLRLACALAVTSSVSGCISYAVVAEKANYRELAIASSLGVVEIGGALLAGYAAYDSENANSGDINSTRGGSMMSFTAGILLADAIVALVLYTNDH